METFHYTLPTARRDALFEHARNPDKSRNDAAVVELLNCFPAGGELRRDAAESYFIAGQLQHIRQGVIEASFPALKGLAMVPMNTDPDDGANQYTSQYEDQVGEVLVVKDFDGILPLVNVSTTTVTVDIFSLWLGYSFTLQEARAAMKANRPLIASRAMRCREQMERKLDNIALLGESKTGIKGLFNLASTATYSTPNGAEGDTEWTTKNPNEILKDMNGAPMQVVVDTLGIEVPDTMVLPLSRFELVGTVKVGDGTADTIMTYFKRNNPHIKTVESSHYLESHADWTGKRMVCYEKNPLKLELIVPRTFEQLMPDVTSTKTVTACHMRTAGVFAHRPKSVIYGDQI